MGLVHVETVLLRWIPVLLAVRPGFPGASGRGGSAPDPGWTTQATGNPLRELGNRPTTLRALRGDGGSRLTSPFDHVCRMSCSDPLY